MAGRIKSMTNSNDLIGNRTHEISACSSIQCFVIGLNNYGYAMPKLIVNNKINNLLNRVVIDGILIYF